MAQVTFTTRASLVAGNPENIADVTDCLDKLLTGVNSVDSTQIAAQQAWQTATGINSIVLHYFKDTLGNVHIRQELVVPVAPGAPVGTSFVTLPTGYRPGTTIYGTATAMAAPGSVTGPSLQAAISLTTAGAMTNVSGSLITAPAAGAGYVFVFPPFRAEN